MKKMEATILNIYNNTALPGSALKKGYGESFCISIGGRKLLFDTGMFGGRLIHNMNKVCIHPDLIDTVVLSHGHRDHTGGLPSLIKSRKTVRPLRVVAHPAALEKKSARMLGIMIPMGMPAAMVKLAQNITLESESGPVTLAPGLCTTGEITERPEKDGTEDSLFHLEAGRLRRDPLYDDISLVLKTAEGLVVITGCCHAGLLNTLSLISAQHREKIHAIIGGTHMIAYNAAEIDHIGEVLQNTYGSPDLLLNHCTGRKAIDRLRKRFGEKKVMNFHAGSSVTYKLQHQYAKQEDTDDN